jgi:sulfur-oxidizing protein SoxB
MFVLALALAVLIGVSLGLLGGGGSILTVPILVYVVGLEPRDGIATSLLVVGVTSAFAMLSHARAGRVQFRTGLLFGVASMAGAYAGGRLAHLLPARTLLLAFTAMMFVTAIAMMRRRADTSETSAPQALRGAALARASALGVGIGLLTGVIGAGGGFVIVPTLVLLCGLPMRTAVGTSLLVIAMNSVAGFAGALSHATIPWTLALAITGASVLGSFGGTALAGRVKPQALRAGFAWFVLGMAVWMSFKQLPASASARLGLSSVTAAPSTRATAAAAPARHVVFLHMADSHAQLETHPEYMPGETPLLPLMGGYARLKTAIDRERAATKAPTFLADGGDTFQGSGPAAWSEGATVLGPLNALGIDICVPGNWEVVYGPKRFRELMGSVTCKVTTYNFHDAKTGERLFAPEITLERGGVRVAFVGITDPTTTQRQPPETVVGLDSTRMTGLRDFVRDVRGREHADLVVAVTHTGITVSRQIAREIPEFDVILSGHTHERTEKAILEGKVIVVEPGSMGSFLGRLDVTLGDNGGVAGFDFKLLPIRAADYPEDPGVKALVDAALAPYRARANEVVGETKTPLLRYDVLETSADNFITDAVREIAGTNVGMSNGFRFAPPIPAGPLTEGDLWLLLPLDARMKKGWATGKELKAYLESELELVFSRDPWKLSGGWGPRASGMTLSFAADAPAGSRLRGLVIDGKPIADDTHVTMAGCERAGEPMDVLCRMRGVHDAAVLPSTVHQALRTYLKRHPVIAPTRDGRSKAVDLPAVVLSQDAVLRSFGNRK